MQYLHMLSFFFTKTTGEDQALWESSRMSLLNMSSVCFLNLSLKCNGTRRGGILIGAALPAFM